MKRFKQPTIFITTHMSSERCKYHENCTHAATPILQRIIEAQAPKRMKTIV